MPETKFLDSVKSMPLLPLPVRTSVIKLSSGTIILSPGSGLSKEQLAQAGDVTDIVAPNLFHCGGMKRAIAAHPNARIWGPLGARDAKPDIKWTHLFRRDNWIHEKELHLITIEGMPGIQEVVFIEDSTKTLYVTDLFFNMKNARGLGARILLGLFGTYRRFALSRLFLKMVKDRGAFEVSLRQMLAHDFDRVVMAHGDVLTSARRAVVDAIRERGFSV